MKNQITFGVALLFAMLTSSSFGQVVTSSADDGSEGTLRKEIADTPPGGEIIFSGVTTITLSMGEIPIDKDLNITGPVTVDANNYCRIFNISGESTVTLDNLTLINGLAEDGGAIYISNASVTINNSTLKYNVANGASGSGGAIFNDAGGVLVVNDSEISSNTANRAGGGIEDSSGAGLGISLYNVNLDYNNAGVAPATAAPGNGGGLHITGPGDVLISGGTAKENIAASEGGGLWNGSGTMTVDGTLIKNNIASGAAADNGGGGIFNNGGTLIVQNATTIRDNVADGASGSGGGIFSTDGSVTIKDSWVAYNTSNRAGGGIEAIEGTLNLTNVTLDYNNTGSSPGNGGGLHITGMADSNIIGGTAKGNTAASEGGGLWNGTGTMTVDGTLIKDNIASGAAADNGGGGIFNNGGTLIVQNATTIRENVADGASGSGGGVFSTDGTVTIKDSWVAYNTSNRAGGGIEAIEGTLNLTNVTLDYNNTGSSPGNGGGLHITGMADSNIIGGTAKGNTAASEGGGLWNGSGTMTVDGTLIKDNIASGAAADNGGGGIFNNGGTLIVQNATTIRDNVADGASGSGGGIFSTDGSVTIKDSWVAYNTSNRAGGGIEAIEGTLNLTNVTLDYNNTGASPGNGGGLHITGMANSNITGGTVNGNVATLEGGGLWNGAGTMVVDGVTIDANKASGNMANEGGGGIFNNGGTLIVKNGTIISNNIADGAASSGGGILNDMGSLTVTNSELSNNTSVRAGGAIEENSIEGSMLTISNTSMLNNSTGAAPGNGGGLHITGPGDSYITGGLVKENSASREGGGLWNGSGVMTVSGTKIEYNVALGAAADDGGAGIFNNGGTLIIKNGAVISYNLATGASASGGGLLSTDGDVSVTDSTFKFNSANRAGGAIEIIDGNLTFTDSDMTDNDVNGTAGTPAPGNGGGLHVTGMTGTINISESLILRNEAGREGGGLWNQSGTIMNVELSTIDGNLTFGPNADDGGAGIFNNGGVLNVMTSTVSNNASSGITSSGGGIHNHTGGDVTLTTSTISGNSTVGAGGGIYNNGKTFVINASTVAQNTATLTGGGIEAVMSVGLKNTIAAYNTAVSGMDVSGNLMSNDYNLIQTDDTAVFEQSANDIEGVDPMLGTLEDNGGQTKTHKLLDGSPAFDAGDPSDVFADQIGQSVFGDSRDIGAFESQMTLSSGEVDLASKLSVYPNPSNGVFSIKIDNSISETVTLKVVSIVGKVVKKEYLRTGVNQIDISDMNSGLYMVNISTGSNSATHKLVLN